MLISKIVSGGQTGVDRGAIAARTLQGERKRSPVCESLRLKQEHYSGKSAAE